LKIEIYHLFRHFDYANWAYPIIIDLLRMWADAEGWSARAAVCREADVLLDTDADVVAFSVYTQTAPLVYRLSAQLRRRGKVVILGGPHFRGSFTHQEGRACCDVLVESICERQWRELLDEIKAGQLEPGAAGEARLIRDVEAEFRYPDDLTAIFKVQKLWQVASVPTSLGCPYDCDFCNPYLKGRYEPRSVEAICSDVASVPRWRPVFFADATFGLRNRHALALLEAIAPLRRKVLLESTLARLGDTTLLDAMASAGVKWITVGVESFGSQMAKHGRSSTRESLLRLLDEAHERGMMIEANFICGLDEDGPESFDQIYDFYATSSLDLIIIDLLTPYPNTRLHQQMLEAGRIIDHNWESYDYRHVVYRPSRMSPEQLIDGFNRLYGQLYSTRMAWRKVGAALALGGLSQQALGIAAYNVWSRFDARRKQRALESTSAPMVLDAGPALPVEGANISWER